MTANASLSNSVNDLLQQNLVIGFPLTYKKLSFNHICCDTTAIHAFVISTQSLAFKRKLK